MVEPSMRDVLEAIRELRVDMRQFRSEVAIRLSGIDGRLSGIDGRIEGVERRLDTLVDAVADLRREYSQHTHDLSRRVDGRAKRVYPISRSYQLHEVGIMTQQTPDTGKVLVLLNSDDQGKAGVLPAFAWPGAYTMYYLTSGNDTLCAVCATVDLLGYLNDPEEGWAYDPPVAYGAFGATEDYPDDDQRCDSCNAVICEGTHEGATS